jgi:hypothetical protein
MARAGAAGSEQLQRRQKPAAATSIEVAPSRLHALARSVVQGAHPRPRRRRWWQVRFEQEGPLGLIFREEWHARLETTYLEIRSRNQAQPRRSR